MADMYFENLPNTTTPLHKDNLNKLNDIKVSPTEPSTGEKVWIKKGKNLIKSFTPGFFYNYINNTYETGTPFSTSEYIDVVVGETYVFSHALNSVGGYIACFDENFLEPLNNDTVLTPFTITNVNCKKIRCISYDSGGNPSQNETWMQLEANSQATSYEPYIPEEMYIKNSNNMYEEFFSPDEKLDKIDNGYNIYMSQLMGPCWIKLGTIMFNAQGQSAIIECMTGEGSNGVAGQNTILQIMLKQGWSGETYPIGFTVNFLQNYNSAYKFKIKHLDKNIAEIYIYLPFAYNDFTYSITGVYSSFVRDFEVLDSEPTGDKNATVYSSGIENITNSNGTAIKYLDGTMICYGSFNVNKPWDTWGSMYAIDATDVATFAQEFYSAPNVSVTSQNTSTACWIATIYADTSKISKITYVRPTSASQSSMGFSYIAIGRWKA